MLCKPAILCVRERGFTLIELLVGVAITAFLLLMVMPSIKEYLLDTRIRVAAQSYYDGAQFARAEALRRNQPVEITLSDSNRAWDVKVGTASLASKSVEAAAMLTVKASGATVTFNGLGQAASGNTVEFEPGGENKCLAAQGAQRCLNVLISPGGQIRICDPSISAAGDNRKC